MALIAFTIVSTADYEMAVEDSAVKEEMIRDFELAQAADSLGLTSEVLLKFKLMTIKETILSVKPGEILEIPLDEAFDVMSYRTKAIEINRELKDKVMTVDGKPPYTISKNSRVNRLYILNNIKEED